MPKKRKITSVKQFAEMSTGVRLSQHEKLCAERMETLIESIKDLRKDVNELKINVAKGKGAVAVLVFLGTVIATVIGFFQYK